MSAKNKYYIEKKQKKSRNSWQITYDSDEYTQQQYGVRSVYRLGYNTGIGEGEDEGSTWCVFGKINGEWKIIDFGIAG